MLANAAIVEAVAAAIEELELPLVVVDPVMVAKSGDRAARRRRRAGDAHRAAAARARRDAEHSGGRGAERHVASDSLERRREAARRIHRPGRAAVDHQGRPRHRATRSSTCCSTASTFTELRTPRIDTREHARHRLHLRVGGRRPAGARARRSPRRRRTRAGAMSPARSGTRSRSATGTGRSIISGTGSPSGSAIRRRDRRSRIAERG